MPLFNDAASSEEDLRRLLVRDALLAMKQSQQEVESQVRTLLRALEGYGPQLIAAQRAVELAVVKAEEEAQRLEEERLEAERAAAEAAEEAAAAAAEAAAAEAAPAAEESTPDGTASGADEEAPATATS